MRTPGSIYLLSAMIFLFSTGISAQVFWDETPQTVTVPLNSVSNYNATCAWICGDSGTVIRTTNRGYNWSVIKNGIPNNIKLVNIFAVDENLALTAGFKDSTTYVYRTSNSGANWVMVFTQTNSLINGIWMSSAANGFMQGNPVSNRWSLWKTTNGGLNWDSAGLFLPQNGAESGLRNSIWGIGSSVWFGTNNSRIYYSQTQGSSWTIQNISPLTTANTIWYDIAPYNRAYAGGNILMKSTNTGSTWTADTLAIGTGTINGITANTQAYGHTFYIRNNQNIYLRTSFTAPFIITYTSPNGIYNHIAMVRTTSMFFGAGYIYAVRNNGRISRGNAFVEGVKLISSEIPPDYSLGQNYPNPFNSSTNIRFQAPVIRNTNKGEIRGGNIRISVYNMQGKEIDVLINKIIQPGVYEINWDADKYSSGLYFYRMDVTNPNGNEALFTKTGKMILLK